MIDVINVGRVLMFTVDSVCPETFETWTFSVWFKIFITIIVFNNNYGQLHYLSSDLTPAVFSL